MSQQKTVPLTLDGRLGRWRALILSQAGYLLLSLLVFAGCRPLLQEPADNAESTTAGREKIADGGARRKQRSEGTAGTATKNASGADTSPAAADRSARPPSIIRRQGTSDITFDDLELDLPAGSLFDRSSLTDTVRRLDGRDIRIRGFIYAGGVFQQTGITQFPLVKNTQCKFGPQGLAYCVILVELRPGLTVDFTTYPITVEGRLSVDPFDSGGFTWSVYRLKVNKVL